MKILLSAGVSIAAAIISLAAPVAANPNLVNPIPGLNGTNGLPQLHGRCRAIFQVTGMASPNRTQDYNILGTDLGIMWDNGRGELLTAYGDTAGLGVPNLLTGSFWAWRSNVLLRSVDRTPADGITYSGAVRDIFGQAKDLVPSPKIPFIEISRIPTAGIAVDGVQYMSMMSVNRWETPGKWITNFASLAVSGDNGENWVEATETRRSNDNGHWKFQMNAFVREGEFVYVYGTPAGRANQAFIARVRPQLLRNLAEYEYWDGKEWRKGDVNAAAPITGGVAELSVQYNAHLGQFVMLTTDPFNSVVMMRAPRPEGPWSPPEVLVDARELPSAYAPILYPYQTGDDLYFLTTIHQQYNVVLMKTTL